MSVSDKEISNVGVSGGDGGGISGSGVDDDDDEDDDGGAHRGDHDHDHQDDDDQRRKQQRDRGKCFGGLSTGLGKRAKKLVSSSFKEKKTRVNKAASCSGKVDKNKSCYFCFTRPSAGELALSPNGSQTSDPNDPNFTYDMLRVLIERNDFFSKECNTHLNSDVCRD